MKLAWWREWRRVREDRTAINPAAVTEAEVEAAVEERRIVARRRVLERRLEQEEKHVNEIEVPEGVRVGDMVSATFIYLPILLALLAAAAYANYWALEGIPSLATWQRIGFASVMCFVAMLGGAGVGHALRMDPGVRRRLVYGGVGAGLLAIAVGGVLGVNWLRVQHLAGLEARQRTFEGDPGTELDAAPLAEPASRAERERQAAATALFTTVGLGAELGTAFAADQVTAALVSWLMVGLLRRRVRRLEDELTELVVQEEDARQHPVLVRAQLEARARATREIEEGRELRVLTVEPALPPPPPVPTDRLPQVIALCVAVVLGLLLLLYFAVLARAGEPGACTAVLLDLSRSMEAREEFPRNVAAVEGLLRQIHESRQRVVVLPITEASFGAPVLLADTTPRELGQYGEHLALWRQRVLGRWRKAAGGLSPIAPKTDVFGALARAAVECDGSSRPWRLLILSDMRDVGRGVNLEQPITDVPGLIERVRRQKLITRLDGVRVWALGVHTAGADERQWQTLRAFWTEYFRLAGAKLVSFSPSRRFAE